MEIPTNTRLKYLPCYNCTTEQHIGKNLETFTYDSRTSAGWLHAIRCKDCGEKVTGIEDVLVTEKWNCRCREVFEEKGWWE